MKLKDEDLVELKHVLNDTMIKKLQDIIVFQEDDGSYVLFDRYVITHTNGQYTVYRIGGNLVNHFYKLKYAVCWCIFDRRDKFYDCRNIIELDRKLSSLEIDIQIHEKMAKRIKNLEERTIFVAKLHEDRSRRNLVLSGLNKYVMESNTWQMNRFKIKP